MTDNEDELYDFYTEEDGFDTQEDLYEQEPIGHHEEPVGSSDSGTFVKRGFKLFFSVFFLVIIAVGSFILYKSYSHHKDTPSIPVVKLDTAPLLKASESSDTLQTISSQTTDSTNRSDQDQGLETEETEISVFAEDLYTDAAERHEVPDAQKDESILTPLPSLAEIQNANISPAALKTDLTDLASNLNLKESPVPAELTEPTESPDKNDKIFSSDSATKPLPVLDEEIYIPEVSAIPPPGEDTEDTAPHGIRIITPKSKPAQTVAQRSATKKKAVTDEKTQKDNRKSVSYQWVIKAILPGKAVIHDKVSGETRSVEVGDYVPSVGKVISIHKPNGTWLVTGSKSKIMQ